MTPGARLSAAIALLDQILCGQPAEQALLRWSRSSRYAGSGDRAAVRDLVFDGLRRRDSLALRGGSRSGRGLMIGYLAETGQAPEDLFTGNGHAPAPLTPDEMAALQAAPDPDADACTDLPAWLAPSWRRSLGPDAGAVALAMTRRAPVWLRSNLRRASPAEAQAALAAEGIETRADARLDSALCVTSGERQVSRSAAYREGLVELQDLSAQLACAALPLSSGDAVLDFCAGGGGKTLALASRQAGLRLTAHDADPRRMADLPTRAARAGIQVALSERPTGQFALVLADVPCSGSGTWRRNPDAKWRLNAEGLAALVAVQAEILDRTAGLVGPGGHLAYMTCSLLDDENGRQIDAFLARMPGLSEVVRRRWSPLDASDGFFLSLLRSVD